MAADANGDNVNPDYLEKLQAFRNSDAERDALVSRIIQDYAELKLKIAEVTDDYKNEVASRRLWQSKATACERDLEQVLASASSSNFALALIDGDGAIFRDVLYSMGKDGGAEAAHQLHGEIQKHLKSLHPSANVEDWTIVVQVVLNFQGLANKLQQCNIINTTNELMAFGQQFGLAHPLFSFVDVGSGKERADHKIRETMRLYMKNAQCKHIFFAPCHDNGYLPVLEHYRRDHSDRLTLIETRPAERGFIELGLKRISVSSVFRSDDLPTLIPSKSRGVLTPAATPSRTLSNMQPSTMPFVPVPKPVSPAPSVDLSTSAANSSSWAAVGKNGAAAKSFSIAPAKKSTRKYILVNVYDDRLDDELPRTDSGAEARFAERLKTKGKCCNAYYLTGYCASGEYCDYLHSEKLSPGELLVLKHKARSRSCPQKWTCKDVNCHYGHRCKYGDRCPQPHCYFKETHGMDMEAAKRVFEDGTEEWLPEYLEKAASKGN